MSVPEQPEPVWFMGCHRSVGYRLRVSTGPGHYDRGAGTYHRPPDFPWESMDREWSACYKPQGATGMDYKEGWSVLSVADYTIDSRPNVLVAFAVQRAMVPADEMCRLAASRYPEVWKRLGVRPGTPEAAE